MLPSFQFPGLLCLGAGFFSLMLPSLACFVLLPDATLMVVASSSEGVELVACFPRPKPSRKRERKRTFTRVCHDRRSSRSTCDVCAWVPRNHRDTIRGKRLAVAYAEPDVVVCRWILVIASGVRTVEECGEAWINVGRIRSPV